MTSPPDIAPVAALIGDPARSRILLALMGGRALTATELALEADVAPSTASAHLAKLADAGLIRRERSGRHRYFQIANEDVAEVIERLCALAALSSADDGVEGDACEPGTSIRRPRLRTGPADPALRRARVCYDHLAGELGVRLYEGLIAKRWLEPGLEGPVPSEAGARALTELGVDLAALRRARRRLCRQCLDWSVRRHHLAGSLGAALLQAIYDRGWASRDLVSRAVCFTAEGERRLAETFFVADLG